MLMVNHSIQTGCSTTTLIAPILIMDIAYPCHSTCDTLASSESIKPKAVFTQAGVWRQLAIDQMKDIIVQLLLKT